MLARWLFAAVVLPGTALVFVPLTILWLTKDSSVAGLETVCFWLAVLLLVPGLLLCISSVSMFFCFGDGTAAPWDPPRQLVIRGPYRYVRNPMLSGVILLLAAEALLFQSWPLAIWAGLFFLVNAVYFPCVEEPGLNRRFGDDYRVYCQNVRRWLPRLTPWALTATELTADE